MSETFYAVMGRDMIGFVGGWNDCQKYAAAHNGDYKFIPLVDGVWPRYDDHKLAIETLNRELEQYKMLYQVTNDDNERLIEKNSNLITLVTSMSNFITTHMEGR